MVEVFDGRGAYLTSSPGFPASFGAWPPNEARKPEDKVIYSMYWVQRLWDHGSSFSYMYFILQCSCK